MSDPILIVGGGLAGLTAARRLHRAGIAFMLLEARNELGGRVLSGDAARNAAADGFDLGPSWFWPALHPTMAALVAELGIQSFPQNRDGDVILQRASGEAPLRYPGLRQEPPSMRLAGGTGALISALASGLPTGSIRLGMHVTRALLAGDMVELGLRDSGSSEQSVSTSHVIFAMPPRLIEATISFSPVLDPATARRWRETPTWMAPHAKFFAVYQRPFWRDAGLSGTAQSAVGPLVEIHDATTASGQAALFGFVGVPAEQRVALGKDPIIEASIRQLADLFGPEAASPVATLFKDWATDPLTATREDRVGGGHPVPDPRPWIGGKWQDHVSLAGSETSSTEPGYLAGAIEAGERAARDVLKRISRGAALRTSATVEEL